MAINKDELFFDLERRSLYAKARAEAVDELEAEYWFWLGQGSALEMVRENVERGDYTAKVSSRDVVKKLADVLVGG